MRNIQEEGRLEWGRTEAQRRSYDDRPAFARYCRQPGTRCNRIMELIDAGMDDKAIADRFRTTADTIAVYRKAHDGTLCRLPKHRGEDEMKELIRALRATGMKPQAIAAALKLDIVTVRNALGHKKDWA